MASVKPTATNQRSVVALVKKTFNQWIDDSCDRLSAALAFYTVWSVGPLFLVVISIAGLVFGRQAAQDQVLAVLKNMVGEQGAASINDTILNAHASGHSLIANIIGIVLLLVSASGVFAELKSSLNVIWRVTPKPGSLWNTLRQRFWSMTVVMGTGFLLLVSLLVDAALSAVGHQLQTSVTGLEVLGHALHFVISLAVTTVLFSLMFKVIPDAKIDWRDTLLGGLVTAVLFTIGQLLIGLYLGHTSIGTAYGAASSLMIVVVWIYFSACILFLGAEFTQVHAEMYGSKIEPSKDAIAVPEGMTPAAATEKKKEEPKKSGARSDAVEGFS
ncbi:MAG: YihY/virulence factor BrkB family protein [Polyangiaceae bacterium]